MRSDVEFLDISDKKWRARSIADRFAVVLAGVDMEAAEKATHRSARQLYRYAKGDEMSVSVVTALADLAGVPAEWIIAGVPRSDGKIFDELLSRLNEEDGEFGGFIPIPRLDVRASAGDGRLAVIDDTEAQVVAFRYDWLRRLGVNPKHAAIIMAEGDSMDPTISHGDLILIDKSIDRIVDEGIYVLVLAGLVLLKRIQVAPSGVVILKSDNAAYDPFEIPPHDLPDLIIEGRVRWAGGAI